MRYLPTLNLWDNTTQDAIKSGQIKLQRGQWLRCGTKGKRCRYVHHTKNSITVVHWKGTAKATNDMFLRSVKCIKEREARQEEIELKRLERAKKDKA